MTLTRRKAKSLLAFFLLGCLFIRLPTVANAQNNQQATVQREDELATRLSIVQTPEERDALLKAQPELVTIIGDALNSLAIIYALQSEYPKALTLFQRNISDDRFV